MNRLHDERIHGTWEVLEQLYGEDEMLLVKENATSSTLVVQKDDEAPSGLTFYLSWIFPFTVSE